MSLGSSTTSSGFNDSPSKYNNPATYSNHFDDRAIKGSGHYDLSMTRNEYDIEEDYDEVVEAKEDKHQLRDVIKNYQRILSGVIEEPEEPELLTRKSELIR